MIQLRWPLGLGPAALRPLALRHLAVGATALLGALGGTAAWAQTPVQVTARAPTPTPTPTPAPAATAPDPGQAGAAVPALVYRSALQSYRPWREQAPGNWRALNDEVSRIGGWRSYLREVHEASAATPPASSATATTPALADRPGPVSPASPAQAAPAAAPSAPAPVHTPAPKASLHGHH